MKFDNKVKMFRKKYSLNIYNRYLTILISRKNLFRDTYENIMNNDPSELKKNLYINIEEKEIITGNLLK